MSGLHVALYEITLYEIAMSLYTFFGHLQAWPTQMDHAISLIHQLILYVLPASLAQRMLSLFLNPLRAFIPNESDRLRLPLEKKPILRER